MYKEKILKILENAKDENGNIPMRLVRTAFNKLPEACEDTISRQAALAALEWKWAGKAAIDAIKNLPSAQPEYEPVTAEDFAKTMSATSIYSYMAWYSEALSLMKRTGFVICKKTI